NIILPESLSLQTGDHHVYPKFNIDIGEKGIDLNGELEAVEKMLIEKALLKAKGSKKKAADLLNISFDSLRYRMEKLHIE
ncbi:MAG TPA: helix-turn-helix domain-containing protein, partial [Smithella sp.]|nr:helix-turn-helix domain-containing protein [Smithella sp.]